MKLYFVAWLQMDSKSWQAISASGKDLVQRLLDLDPDRRLTVDQALLHPWIRVREFGMIFV